MSDFLDARAALQNSRVARADAKREYYLKQQQQRLQELKIKDRLRQERRVFLPDDDQDQVLLNEIQEEVYQLQVALDKRDNEVKRLEEALDQTGSAIRQVAQLNDHFPIMLMPVRLQTRFVTVKHVTQNIKEENLFDLSQTEELKSDDVAEYRSSITQRGIYQIRKDWYAYHLYGQDDYKSRPWLKIVPDQKELWIRIYPDDIFVHSHEEALTPKERAIGESFWKTWQDETAQNPLALSRERNPEYRGEKPLTAAWTNLQAHFGASRAAWIMQQTNPEHSSDETVELKSDSWTEAIQTFVLPDKFVATLNQGVLSKSFEGKRIPHPLTLSPLPSPDATLDEISWAKDFEEAERIGMAIRIPIEKEGFAPTELFDQLIVVGVKTSAGADEGKELLEKLLDNHRYKRAGMAILPQGTSTNNFEQVRSGYTERGLPAEETFKLVTGPPQFSSELEWSSKKDGQYLVEALSIDPTVFNRVQAGAASDIAHAKAMHRLLWSATLGYYLHQFWQPLISPEAAEKTRDFLWDFVAGSGLLPVFRVGKQPYGVLPMTNFKNWKVRTNDEDFSFFQNLYENVLKKLDRQWIQFASKVQQVSNPDESYHKYSEEFMKMLSLSASSQVMLQRHQLGDYLMKNANTANLKERPTSNNDSTGGGSKSRIFHQRFLKRYRHWSIDLVDTLKPSDKRKLSKININGKDWNYLEWLQHSNYQALMDIHFKLINAEEGHPNTLLYLLARQALGRNYIEAASRLMPNSVKKEDISTIDFELEHLTGDNLYTSESGSISHGKEIDHFLENIGKPKGQMQAHHYIYSNNKWAYLQEKTSETSEQTVGEYIEAKLEANDQEEALQPLKDAKKALELLKDCSTAGLQRLLTEHLDLCNYRLDSWMLGLVNRRLDYLRKTDAGKEGIYLGAYGYLEKLNPAKIKDQYTFRIVEEPDIEENPGIREYKEWFMTRHVPNFILPYIDFAAYRQADIPPEEVLKNAVVYLGSGTSGEIHRPIGDTKRFIQAPRVDPGNEGFIHTPSQAHAATAAILRSGYLANNAKKFTDEFAVNLNSRRVRKALYYLEGIKSGQELPAMLGYQFERFLHDSEVPYLDAYLQQFRRVFPLIKPQESDSENQSETIAPRNVVNGLDLLNVYRESNENVDQVLNKRVNLEIEGADIPKTKAAIKDALDQLNDHLDAISDLLMAESVYQVAQGNLNGAAASLKMLSDDQDIKIPEIIQTPKKGKPLSHIIGIQFDLERSEKIWAGVDSPRSLLNPGLNRWLTQQLPNPRNMCINVEVAGVLKQLSIRNLVLQPIDFLALFQNNNPLSATSPLSYYLEEVAVKFYKPAPEDTIKVLYDDRTGLKDGQWTLLELLPLIDNLRTTLSHSRPLFPKDLQLTAESRPLEPETWEHLENTPTIQILQGIIHGNDRRYIARTLTRIKSYNQYFSTILESGTVQPDTQAGYERMRQILMDTSYLNPSLENYHLPRTFSSENAERILEKGLRAQKYYEQLLARANHQLDILKEISNKKDQWEAITEMAKSIFGNTIQLSPFFKLNNPSEIQAALDFPDLMKDVSAEAPTEWLQGVALVRKKTAAYKQLESLRTLFKTEADNSTLRIFQLPFQTDADNYRWLGSTFRSDITIKGEQLSLAFEMPENFAVDALQSGMIIDFWTEKIQENKRETALALHYNQANSEPPQSVLLCVSPELTGTWQWEDVMGCVTETIEMAKKRAVEPAFLNEDVKVTYQEGSRLGRHLLKSLLPALSLPVTSSDHVPALRFDEDSNLY